MQKMHIIETVISRVAHILRDTKDFMAYMKFHEKGNDVTYISLVFIHPSQEHLMVNITFLLDSDMQLVYKLQLSLMCQSSVNYC